MPEPAHPASPRRPAPGLTLIEVLIGLALAAILLAQAGPDLRGLLAGYRLSGQGSALSQALAYAKSEAVTRGIRVTVCTSAAPTAAYPACSSGAGWAAGWLVFVDNVQTAGNAPGLVDGADTVLRIGEPLRGATVSAAANLAGWVAFSPDGLALASGGSPVGSIVLCQGGKGHSVVLNNVGRVTTSSGGC